MMSEHDKLLVESSRHMCWEDINEDDAETPEGKAALHAIAVRKYHYDEYKAGMI